MVDRDVNCATVFRATLTLDDVGLAASARRIDLSNTNDVIVLDGVTNASVAPGSHSLKVLGDCEIGNATLGALNYATHKAIVIGT